MSELHLPRDQRSSERVAPRPYEVSHILSSIHPRLLARLGRHYKTAYLEGYRSGTGERVNIRKTGHSDPTALIAAEKENTRWNVAFAARRIREAAIALDEADEALSRETGRFSEAEIRHRAGEVDPEEVRAGKEYLHRVVRKGQRRQG